MHWYNERKERNCGCWVEFLSQGKWRHWKGAKWHSSCIYINFHLFKQQLCLLIIKLCISKASFFIFDTFLTHPSWSPQKRDLLWFRRCVLPLLYLTDQCGLHSDTKFPIFVEALNANFLTGVPCKANYLMASWERLEGLLQSRSMFLSVFVMTIPPASFVKQWIRCWLL